MYSEYQVNVKGDVAATSQLQREYFNPSLIGFVYWLQEQHFEIQVII
jgi:hypothetical protein